MQRDKEEYVYKHYMATLAMNAVNNLVEPNMKIVKTFNEVLHPAKAETRTPEEIIADMKDKLNGKKNELI